MGIGVWIDHDDHHVEALGMLPRYRLPLIWKVQYRSQDDFFE